MECCMCPKCGINSSDKLVSDTAPRASCLRNFYVILVVLRHYILMNKETYSYSTLWAVVGRSAATWKTRGCFSYSPSQRGVLDDRRPPGRHRVHKLPEPAVLKGDAHGADQRASAHALGGKVYDLQPVDAAGATHRHVRLAVGKSAGKVHRKKVNRRPLGALVDRQRPGQRQRDLGPGERSPAGTAPSRTE